MRAKHIAVPLAAVIASAGCYRYAEIPVSDLREGMSVQLQVSGVGVDRIRSSGSGGGSLLEGFGVSGTVASLGGDTLLLSVPRTVMEANVRQRTTLHDLMLFRTEVRDVRLRRFDRQRTTWAIVTLGAVVAASVTFALQRGGRSSGTNTPPPPPPETRIPLFR
jgi:hypothetical protein